MSQADAVARALEADDGATPAERLKALVASGLDRLPLPGHGATLQRWQVLSAVARVDLALTKWFESHTDALAIRSEIDPSFSPQAGQVYAVWASESREDPVRLGPSDTAVVSGRKSWCSGAAIVDRGLMTATSADGVRYLVEIDLRSPNVSIDRTRWNAVGMAASESFDVVCDRVPAMVVGPPNAYLERPGFWHGGAGIAACWYGAAAAIGARVRDLQKGRDDAHALAHLGEIDGALSAAASLLRECAREIDEQPAQDAMHIALRARTFVAGIAEFVMHHAARAIGPGPLCNDARLARLFADLPIFIRQSRGEHDLATVGRAAVARIDHDATGWSL